MLPKRPEPAILILSCRQSPNRSCYIHLVPEHQWNTLQDGGLPAGSHLAQAMPRSGVFCTIKKIDRAYVNHKLGASTSLIPLEEGINPLVLATFTGSEEYQNRPRILFYGFVCFPLPLSWFLSGPTLQSLRCNRRP